MNQIFPGTLFLSVAGRKTVANVFKLKAFHRTVVSQITRISTARH